MKENGREIREKLYELFSKQNAMFTHLFTVDLEYDMDAKQYLEFDKIY